MGCSAVRKKLSDDFNNASARNGVFNSAGYVFTSFISTYTFLLIVGLSIIYVCRQHTAVRLRNPMMIIISVLALHVYVAALFIVYPVKNTYTCSEEFWYMSVIFPLGIGIFSASNLRLLAVSQQQENLFRHKRWSRTGAGFGLKPKQAWRWYLFIPYHQKVYIWTGFGILIQLLVSLFLFYGSRRFRPASGFFGTHVDETHCRRGFEWIPSIVWQFVWTWLLGPCVLFMSRDIKDTHHWALQTRLAIVAGLPGAPLWLAFLYSNNPSIAVIDQWIYPAIWFAPGLLTMELTTLLIPLLLILRTYQHTRAHPIPSSSSNPSPATTHPVPIPSLSSHQHPATQITAAIANSYPTFTWFLANRTPSLHHFAAHADLTAENVEFVTRARAFRARWAPAPSSQPNTNPRATPTHSTPTDPDPDPDPGSDPSRRREMYEDAARIYFELVCPRTAAVEINIDDRTRADLDALFAGLDYACGGGGGDDEDASVASSSSAGSAGSAFNEITPWEPLRTCASARALVVPPPPPPRPNTQLAPPHGQILYKHHANTTTNSPLDPNPINAAVDAADAADPADLVADIPRAFHAAVFDRADDHVRRLMFHNTWQKFVRSGAYQRSAVEMNTTTTSAREVRGRGGSGALLRGWEGARRRGG